MVQHIAGLLYKCIGLRSAFDDESFMFGDDLCVLRDVASYRVLLRFITPWHVHCKR